MTEPSGDPQSGSSFSKATVDRWQVFGGVAGVSALVFSVVTTVKDLFPLSLVTSSLVALVGIVLLYRWGRKHQEQTVRGFIVPMLVAVIGAITTGLTGGIGLQAAVGVVSDRGNFDTDTSGRSNSVTTTTVATSAPSTTIGLPGSEEKPATGDLKPHRKGRVTIHEGLHIDLDSPGEDGGVQQLSTDGYDLYYFSAGIASANFEPHMTIPTNTAEYSDCAAATGRTGSIYNDKLEDGFAFCVETTEGRWARITVVHRKPSEKPKNNEIELDVLVWSER